MTPVISSGLQSASMPSIIRSAGALDATAGPPRPDLRAVRRPRCAGRAMAGARRGCARKSSARAAPEAAEHGLTLVIENHQDFGSDELVALCEEAGPNVGIVFDTGNTFPVAEAPLDFTRRIAAHVRHVHLKDYRVQFTDEGYRLVRCAIGDGAVPFREMAEILLAHTPR